MWLRLIPIILNPWGLRTFAIKKLSKLLSEAQIIGAVNSGFDDKQDCFTDLIHAFRCGYYSMKSG